MLNYVCMLYVYPTCPTTVSPEQTTYVYLLSVLCLPIDSLRHVFLAYYMAAVLISCLSLHVYAYYVFAN